MKYLNLSSSGSKLESGSKLVQSLLKIALRHSYFSKNFTVTATLKNASWWLLLRTALFWKYSWMAAFQRQLQSIFILKFLNYTYLYFLLWRHVKEGRIFADFFLSKGFDEKYKETVLALNFIQKQSFR